MAQNRIVCDPGILSGKPIIKGTRISVAMILQYLASGMKVEQILEGHPALTYEGVIAALAFAARQMEGEEINLLENPA